MNKENETLDLNEIMKDFGGKPSMVIPEQPYHIKYKGISRRESVANAQSTRENAVDSIIGFPNAHYAHYLPCVEQMVGRIADKWSSEYDQKTFNRLTNVFCQRMASSKGLRCMTYADANLIHQIADTVECDTLGIKTPHKST